MESPSNHQNFTHGFTDALDLLQCYQNWICDDNLNMAIAKLPDYFEDSGSSSKDKQLPQSSVTVEETVSVTPDTVPGSSSKIPKDKRKRENISPGRVRKNLNDQIDREKIKADVTYDKLQLLCLKTLPENREYLSHVNQKFSPLKFDFKPMKDNIKRDLKDCQKGTLNVEGYCKKQKEIKRTLKDLAATNAKINKKIKNLELKLNTLTLDSIESELKPLFPKTSVDESTAIYGSQKKAAVPKYAVFLQLINDMGTSIDDNFADMKEIIDSNLKRLSPQMSERESIRKKANEAGFQKKDAETWLKISFFIYKHLS